MWSINDQKLTARVRVPATVERVIAERDGGVILLMGEEIGRLDPESQFSSEKMTSIKLDMRPSSVFFHEKENSLCIFDNQGAETTLKVLDAVTLQEKKTYPIKAALSGGCTVSPDFKIVLMLDAKGKLSLCELSTGEVFPVDGKQMSGELKQMTGEDQLGAILSVLFTEDMKYLALWMPKGCLILDAKNLGFVKFLPNPDEFGFVTAKGIPEDSDLIVVSRSGLVYTMADDFNVSEADMGRTTTFDLSVIGTGGELVLLADTEGKDFDVYSISGQKMVLSDSGEK